MRGTWGAQSVKSPNTLDFSSDHDLKVVRFSLTLGSRAPGWARSLLKIPSAPPPLSLELMGSHSLSLQNKGFIAIPELPTLRYPNKTTRLQYKDYIFSGLLGTREPHHLQKKENQLGISLLNNQVQTKSTVEPYLKLTEQKILNEIYILPKISCLTKLSLNFKRKRKSFNTEVLR